MELTTTGSIMIRLSGGVRVQVGDESRADLGTSRNRSLLALLALRMGSVTTREFAIETIWPDVDTDVGRNRLSTALVHLRKLLTLPDRPGGTALVTDHIYLSLNPQICDVDVRLIEKLYEQSDRDSASSPQSLSRLEDAFGLYQGDLAPEVYDSWITDYQIQFSESVDMLCERLVRAQVDAGRLEDARRALHRFKRLCSTTEPDGWQDHVEIPRSSSSSELTHPAPPRSDGSVRTDYGALSPDSPLYIERETDRHFHQSLADSESIVLVKGPRQIGKTSLVARGVHAAKSRNTRTVFVDFQKFPTSIIKDESAFYLAIAHAVANQMGFSYDFDRRWNPSYGVGMNLDYFIHDAIAQAPTPLIWFIDEGDKLFESEFASDFYGLIRSFHNQRAIEGDGPLSRLTITISYATEAYLFIKDMNQSPFNVGRRINLDDFDQQQAVMLNERLGSPLQSASGVDRLISYVGGHPFLIRRSLSLIREGLRLDDLLETGHRRNGPLADHLNRILASVTYSTDVLKCVSDVLGGQEVAYGDALHRLVAAGVLKWGPNQTAVVRNVLYERFLGEALSQSGSDLR